MPLEDYEIFFDVVADATRASVELFLIDGVQ